MSVATLEDFRAVNARINFDDEQYKGFREGISASIDAAKSIHEFSTAASTFINATNDLTERLPRLFPSKSTRRRVGAYGEMSDESFNLTFPSMIAEAAEKAEEHGERNGRIDIRELFGRFTAVHAEVLLPYRRTATSLWLDTVSTAVEKVVLGGYSDKRIDGSSCAPRPFAAVLDYTKQRQTVKAYCGEDYADEEDVEDVESLFDTVIATLPNSAEAPQIKLAYSTNILNF